MPVKTACLPLYEALQESPSLEDVHDIAVAVGNFAGTIASDYAPT